MDWVCGALGIAVAVWFPALAVAVAGWGALTARIDRLEGQVRALDRALAEARAGGAGGAARALPVAVIAPEPLPTDVPDLPAAERPAADGPAAEAPALQPPVIPPRATPSGPPTLPPIGPPPSPARPPKPTPPRRPPSPPLTLPSPERIAVWLGAGIGGLTVVLTALFLLVLAVERGFLGPAARVSGGLVAATALWVGGTVARRKSPVVGSALAGAGIGAAYGALYAGASRYGLLPIPLASAAMIGVTALATARAAVLADRFVAWLALIGGLLTPVLVSTGENRPIALFLYLALLALGMLFAARRCNWPDIVIGMAVGAGGMHLGWASQWYTADQTGPALIGAALLTVPFALVATSVKLPVRISASIAAAGLPIVAAPWVVPVSSSFTDPRSGLWMTRAEPNALAIAALAAALLALPSFLVGRWHDQRIQASLAAVPGGLLALVFTVGWSVGGDAVNGWVVAGAIGGATLASVLAFRKAEASLGLTLWWAVSGLALTIAVAAAPALAIGIGAVVLIGVGSAIGARSGWGGVPLLALAVLGLPLMVAANAFDQQAAIAGAALITLSWAVQTPVRRTWSSGAGLAWTASAAAGLALFPALYALWLDAFGDVAIGLLPVLLAAFALLAAGALARRQRLTLDDAVVAVFALVILLGVTAAVPLQLRDRWLTVAWALEAAALAIGSRWLRHPLVRVASVALIAAVGVRLVVNPWALAWGTASEGWPILNWTLYSWGVPLVCTLVVARQLPRRLPDGEPDPADPFALVAAPLGIVAAFIGFALVNVEVSHAFQDQGALELAGNDKLSSMVRSAAWAAYGLTVLGIGSWRDSRVVRLLGFAFVLLATVKVFAFDLWDLQGLVRVGSMGCLGVSLILAALAFERLVLRGSKRAEPSPSPSLAPSTPSAE